MAKGIANAANANLAFLRVEYQFESRHLFAGPVWFGRRFIFAESQSRLLKASDELEHRGYRHKVTKKQMLELLKDLKDFEKEVFPTADPVRGN